MQNIIVQPVLALMLLTFLVWCYMYFLRLKYVIANKINAQKLETPEQCNSLLPSHINKPSNNFKNLFEAPIIFYVICILSMLINQVDNTLVYLAWSFVIGRVIHSIFHCFSSSVMARFYAYFISSIILWVMLIKFAYSVAAIT
jgi:hypothetical protein